MDESGTFDLNGRSVLIVEDEVMIAMLAEDVIEELGGRVSGLAADCEAALAMLASDTPDVILLDVNLNGEVSDAVLAAAQERRVPVLVSSGSDAGALPPPFQNYPLLNKPWAFDDMRVGLASALQAAPV